MLIELTELEEKLNEAREDVWNKLDAVRSLKNVINYMETGKTYPEEVF